MVKKHDEGSVIRLLGRLQGVTIYPGTKTIKIKTNATIGIHSWGKIDYLTNYCGYTVIKED